MQPLSRAYSFAVGLASTLVGTTLAVLLLQQPNPAPTWVMVALAIAGPVLTWMGTQGRAILQGKDVEPMLRVLLPVVFLAALAGCAAPWRGAAIGISTVDRAAVEAAKEWEAFDKAKDTAIVDEGHAKNTPHAEVRKRLDEWRATSDRVNLGFAALRDASSAAKAGVVMASQGKASIAGVLSALLDGVRAFLGVLKAAGVKLPGELAGLIGGAL